MSKNNYLIVSYVLLALVLFSRLIPHAPNFTPIIAVVLFSSMMFRSKLYIAIPIVALLISDFMLQYQAGYQYMFSSVFFWTYGALFLIFLLSFFYMKDITFKNVLLKSFLGAMIFFLISNFGVWIMSPGYPLNFSGLISCYTAAIPFFRNTLSSTIIYSLIIFSPILLKNKNLLRDSILSKNS
tara:strand:- start:1159 stop:1707 length:549 start_codon:yes stop_codon:yes gene_type:complete